MTEQQGACSAERRAAAVAVVRTWVAVGWPRPPRGLGHARLREKLIEYVRAFDRAPFSDEEQHAIVESALTSFMANLHLRPRSVDPMSLVRAVDDMTIEQWKARWQDPPGRHRAADVRGDGDEELVARVLGVGATCVAVKVGLEALADEGKKAEIQIVLLSLDLAHVSDPAERARWVASILCATPGSWSPSEQDVSAALTAFSARIASEPT